MDGWLRQCWNFAGEAAGPCPPGEVFMNMTSRSGSGNGTGFNNTALTIEKMAVFAPMPSASAAMAVTVNAFACLNIRRECFRSFKKVSMDLPQWDKDAKSCKKVPVGFSQMNCNGGLWSCEKIGIGRFPSLHHRKQGNRPIPIFSQLHRPPLQLRTSDPAIRWAKPSS